MARFEIGYGRPPRHTRFQPGMSGNPRGRVKGVCNLGTDVRRTLQTPVKVSDQGKPKRVSTQEAALLRLREKALKVMPRRSTVCWSSQGCSTAPSIRRHVVTR